MLAPGSTVRDSCTLAPSMGGSKGISRRHCQGHLRAVLDGWLDLLDGSTGRYYHL